MGRCSILLAALFVLISFSDCKPNPHKSTSEELDRDRNRGDRGRFRDVGDEDRDRGWRRNGGGGTDGTRLGDGGCTLEACYMDTPGNRLLRGLHGGNDFSWQAGDMNIPKCMDYCKSRGFRLAGLEFATYCFCGDSFAYSPTTSVNCNTACGGRAEENCGGSNAISVYRC